MRHGKVTEYDPPARISFHQPMQVKQGFLTGTIDIHLRHILEQVEQMTRLNRDLTLGIEGLLKVAQPSSSPRFARRMNACSWL